MGVEQRQRDAQLAVVLCDDCQAQTEAEHGLRAGSVFDLGQPRAHVDETWTSLHQDPLRVNRQLALPKHPPARLTG